MGIIDSGLKMTEDEKMIYLKTREPVSYNADYAISDYVERIKYLCPKYPNISHALLRIAAEPMFCMGFCEANEMHEVFRDRSNNDSEFCSWLKENIGLIELCAKEMAIRYLFLDCKVTMNAKSAVFTFKRCEEVCDMSTYYNDITKDSSSFTKTFYSYEEFRAYFYSFFSKLAMPEEEIELNLFELEDYHHKIGGNDYFYFLRSL